MYHLATSPLLLVGIAMLLIGFGFKVATVPFHMWAPDVYEGAPSPITAYMAATVKAAAFAAFIRVWLEAFPSAFAAWHPALSGLAIATMIFGNAIGLAQKNLKRLLAYSSIGHAGYLLVAIAAGTFAGLFGDAVLSVRLHARDVRRVRRRRDAHARGRDGRHARRARRACGRCVRGSPLAMAVIMLALLGFPIFGGAGFFAKWYVLQAALQAPVQQTTLAVVLVLTTVLSAGYYLYVVMVMFMRPRPEDAPRIERSGGLTQMVLAVSGRAHPHHRVRARLRRARHTEWTSANGDRGFDHATAAASDNGTARLGAARRRHAPGRANPLIQRGRAAAPFTLERRDGHRSRDLSPVRHSRHRRQGSHDGGRACDRRRVRGIHGGALDQRRHRRQSRQSTERSRAARRARRRGSPKRASTSIDVGVVPTPLNYWALHHLPVVGGIQITGSHNPPEYNGFKLSVGTASMHGDEIQHLYELTQRAARQGRDEGHDSRRGGHRPLHRRRRSSASGSSHVRCASCTTAATAPARSSRRSCSRKLGVEGRGLFCESDGTFPNHHPDPTVPENLEDLIAAVKADGAEIGIAFDGDADRIGVVDENGGSCGAIGF